MSTISSDCKSASQGTTAEPAICRDYLRNVCKRGRRCKFWHPPQMECEKIRRSERIFCHDYQNSICRRPACKFLHYSREDEEIFRLTGLLPNELDQNHDGSNPNSTVEEMPPICKDYLNGICSRGPACKYRHISTPMDKRPPRTSMDNPTQFRLDHLPEDPNTALSSSRTAPMLSNQISSRGVIPLQPPTATALMAVTTSLPSSDRSHPSQPLSISSNIVSASDSIATPMKDMYVSSNAPPTPLVGVVDHVGLQSSNIHHTLYAHPHSLGTFTPLVSVSSTSQPVPCSSVLAVVAESSHHPAAVLQHPNAVATSQTTYHLLSNTPTPIQPHLLSSSSSVSSAPTLLTIPLPQFACDNTTTGALLSSHGNSACTTHQHPSVLTSVLPASGALTNTSGTCFSSYNVLQITPSSAVETHAVPVFATQHPVSGAVTTSVSSSTSAVLAAAAAAGYWAQHLPVVGGAPCSVSVSASQSHLTPTVSGGNLRYGLKHDLIESGNHDSAALAAAANLPAVSAAAAAAVAAAKAFVARTTPVSSDHAACSSDNPQCRVNNFQDSAMVQNISQVKPPPSNTDESQGVQHQSPACCLTATITTATMSTATVTGPQSHSHTAPSAVTSSHLSSSSSCFLHPNEEEEEQHAKTAAAVAAAACIGAMFSQPLGTASSTSSSVAAMLGDLMGQNHLNLKSNRSNHHSGEFNPQSSRAFSDDHKSAMSEDNDDGCHANEGDSRTFPGDGPLCAHECNDQSSLSASHAASDSADVSVSDGRTFSHSHMEFANSSAWSSVATTVASAAQAAAAAAVVATQAVTRSAKFYQLARKNQHQSEVSSRATSHLGSSDDTTTGDSSSQSTAQSPPADPGRPSLSPNTAVTMTAAVMAAAAATAAAKQRRILSGVRHSPYAECAETPYIKQPRITLQPKEFSDAEDSEYSIACHDADRYTQLKRILKGRSAASMYGYVRLRRNSLEVDEDEEDPDAFEDDVATAMSIALSPEVTPPYGIPMKRKKHHLRDSMYTNQTDDSHPGSEYTSPSDTFDGEHYHNSRQNDENHIHTEHKLKSSISCLNHTRSGLINVPISTVTSDVPCIPKSASLSTGAITASNFSPLRPQRCRSQPITISSSGLLPTSLRRAHSSPSLRSGLISVQLNIASDASRARSTVQSSITSGIAKNTREIAPSLSSPSANESHPLNLKTVHVPRSSFKPHLPVSRLAYERKSHPRSPHIKPGILSRSAKSTKKLVVQQRSETRSQATASPDSIMTEDLSGHDDIDDPEFIDTEDYDDELFDLRSRNPSLKRPAPLGRNRWRIPGRLPTCSASMRQHHALRAENARLRRKLSELMRQRGDLRAANEILLEQNARLRHSSKRVSAVARMAESATKIIEAHSKSQLSQPAHQPLTPSVFPSVDPQMSQLTNRFSLTHAAAAAAAAAVAQQEQHSTAPTIHGVYVSAPTTSTTQQASQAVTALGGHHPIFPSAMVTGSVPGAIALSNSHQSLAAVQIRASTDPLVPTSVAPQPPNMVQQQSMDGQQHPVSSFYQHHLHPMGSLPGSITNITPHSNLAPASSAIQVCHYPIRSSGTVFPSLHQATAVTPSIVPIGASSAVTLLVGQAPTAYAPVGSSLSTAALHLSNTAKTEPTPVNVAPVPQLSYMYQGPSGTFGSSNQCLPANSLSTADTIVPSNVTNNVTTTDHLRHLDTRPNIV